MSFSEDKLLDKLNSLEETQDSIVSTSQWVLFHYRHAERIAPEWEKYLAKAPIQKKLAIIYLANDVVQQSRAKRKTEFINAFAKLLPRSLSQAYKEVPEPVKQKIKKIVDIWQQRRIFPEPVKLNVSGGSGNGHEHSVASSVSYDDKIKSLGLSAQKFQKFYHELLLGSNGNFKAKDINVLNSLKKVISDNIIQLQDLTETIDDELIHISDREKVTEQKRLEVEQKQKELEEQRRKEEQQRIEEEKRRQEEEQRIQEEESMLPTYEADSNSDSDDNNNKSDSDSDSDSDSEDDKPKDANNTNNENGKREEEDENDKQNTETQPPVKKLRFAE